MPSFRFVVKRWFDAALDLPLFMCYLLALNQPYPPESEEPTSRTVVVVEWILKAPVFYSGNFIAAKVLNLEQTSAIILLVAIVSLTWEFLSVRVLKLPARIYTRIIRHQIRQRAESFLVQRPSDSRALMVLTICIVVSWVMLFAVGVAEYVFQ